MGKPKQWLGLDIGGANLKAATSDGFACEVAFPLWQKPGELADAIAALVAEAPPHRGFAVTMTGELADCYATKAEGVAEIVSAVELAAMGRETRYYSQTHSPGITLDAAAAIELWPSVAAANYHAIATACRRSYDIDGDLLIDVGSTTTDIVPLDGLCGMTDTERLLSRRLLYQGVGRTPVCAVVDTLPYRGGECPVAAELFATTADIALLLGYAEPNDSCDTADGRPFDKPNAVARLGRMLCADASEFDEDDALTAAKAVCAELERRLAAAIDRVVASMEAGPRAIVISGRGAWLARAALLRAGCLDGVTKLADVIGDDASRCAPAWAVATLLDEWSRS